MKKLCTALLVLLLAAQTASCASGDTQTGGDTASVGETTQAADEAYDFGELDMGGGDFVILNFNQMT